MADDLTIPALLRLEAEQFAHVLAEGAEAARQDDAAPEVRLVVLPAEIRSWSGKQVTLQNQLTIGAYVVIKQTDGSRWLYTTTQGRAQTATLNRWATDGITLLTANTYEELVPALEQSLLDAMRNATTDGRSRRATARGFDPQQAARERNQVQRFQAIADGREHVTEDDLDAFLAWWNNETDPRVTRMLGGLPVDEHTHQIAINTGATSRWNLVPPSGHTRN